MVEPKKKLVNSSVQPPLPLTTTMANGRNVIQSLLLEVDIRVLLLRCSSRFIDAHTVQAYRSARSARSAWPAHTLPCNHKTDTILVYYPSICVCVCVCAHIRPLYTLPCVDYKFSRRRKNSFYSFLL